MSGSIIGSRVLRTEDPRLLTVGGRYLDDVEVPDLAYVTYLRSPIAHARINGIDVAEAAQSPGVLGIVTAGDVAGFPPPPPPDPKINPGMVQPWLATDRVRYVGEPVAAIVTADRYSGEDAAELIAIDYEPLPALLDVNRSVAADVLLFPELGSNTAYEVSVSNATDIFADCDVVVSQRMVFPRLAPCPLEVRGALAQWNGDRLTFWVSTQTPHRVRDDLAGVFGLDHSDVRVVAPDVGGGFGAKIGDYPDELFVAWLARHFRRPLKWIETRSESMVATGHGRAQQQDIKIGGTRDGKILAYQLHAIQDAGGYPRVGAILPYWTRTVVPGPYSIPRVAFSCTSVVTNTTPVVAYRGAGRPEATLAVERAVDLFATELGIDPTEVRRRNLVHAEDFPFTTAMGVTYDSGDYTRALDLALEKAGYHSLRREQQRRRDEGAPIQIGIGVSTYVEITAGTLEGEFGAVELVDGERLVVRTGTSPHGQGHATSWAMIVSDETGIPLENIEVHHGDTAEVPRGVGTYGSRSLQTGGVAVRQAAVALVDHARNIAADILETAPGDMVLDKDRGLFHVVGDPAANVSWEKIREVAHDRGEELAANADHTPLAASFPFGAHVVVVEIDMETGKVTIAKVVAVDDAGRIINPMLAQGQVHGGLAQGLASGLLEEMRYDSEGNPLTTNFADYPVISAAELPDFETFHTETPSPTNPLGVKGIGEAGTIGSAPAIQSAVVDALSYRGVRHIDIPASPMRVWEVLHAQGSDEGGSTS